ncbi:MAG: SDR family oxidoreductase [Aestuariivirgaceae bacterium]|jgi:3-oxoacyl-[acyl-carrier protein] reductase
MDLGIAGLTAIVCASSRGLGKACAAALAREGVRVVINGRDPAHLRAAMAEIRREAAGEVVAVEADVATPAGRSALLAAAGRADILVNNAGGPPTGDFRDFSRDDWLAAIDANMLSAVELIKATIDPMISRRFGRIVNITSGAVKAPISYLALSNGARSGLTGFVAGLSREVSRHNVTINNLLPGSFETDRLVDTARTQAEREGLSEEEQLARWRAGEVSGRFGRPEEFGAVCAFLCSTHAGYITGQNLLMDGGTYPGTF